jgi:hypothetical protein
MSSWKLSSWKSLLPLCAAIAIAAPVFTKTAVAQIERRPCVSGASANCDNTMPQAPTAMGAFNEGMPPIHEPVQTFHVPVIPAPVANAPPPEPEGTVTVKPQEGPSAEETEAGNRPLADGETRSLPRP